MKEIATNMSDGTNSSLQSMTGFARATGEVSLESKTLSYVWEIRSLNNKGLDIRSRLPSWLESLEQTIRAEIKAKIFRGSITANLTLKSAENTQNLSINHDVLEQAVAAASLIQEKLPTAQPASTDGILSVRGLISVAESDLTDEEKELLSRNLIQSLQQALASLCDARSDEGKALFNLLTGHLNEISRLLKLAKNEAETATEALRTRLYDQVNSLVGDAVSEERLAQEVTLLAVKADIREELDRLDAHLASAKTLLREREPVGRKLDFLIQELNREANTLCSKAHNLELKNIGLSMKATIDQMREQVQNVQ
ncbi:MAG: YicC family protein [Aquisalinus sp.]|nr:YicC family protein [Aquisalinus sp.]